MAKEHQETQTTLETWLLNFELQAGSPVVVSLLIENGHIEFMNCANKKHFSMEWDSAEDNSPEVNVKDIKEDSIQAGINKQDYIG